MWSVIPDSPPDREQLQAFGLVVALAVAGLAAVLGWRLGASATAVAVVAAVAAAALSAAAWRRPDAFEGGYRLWRRAASAYARRARKALLAICYYTVVAAAGRRPGGLRFGPSDAGESQWTPRATLPPEEYGGQGGGLRTARTGASGDLSAWARSSGHLWTLFLIPFLLLLASFDPHDEPGSPESIYTLY